ncbi:amino acid transporter [Deinobacterium chartae]|uniref:Amino acid transporter n=1 Tax=Deinobacterium chartae TaxID=521158 RepID=A0A841HWE3_9DEIO|nr:APC family permease [Deinobacterium chartae]MBB6097163.1 amino acid transporter [Deinobacterium chartae]
MSSLKRNIAPLPLLFTGLGSIIGSGWLFGAWNTAQIAGPAAILAWVVGMVMMLTIAITYTELGAMFPQSGAMGRYAGYSHGPFVGFLASWANWLSMIAIPPIEAVASVQYMTSWEWAWARGLTEGGNLTPSGLALATAFLVVYFLLNFWTVQLFAKSNTAITVFKIVVPLLVGVALLTLGFHPENFDAASGGFAPFGWAAVFTGVATSGIVLSFNGFQAPINLAGEARNPGRSVPFAVVGAIVLAGILYVLLQVAFIGAVPPERLTEGWKALKFDSPFADLALALGLNWMAILLYVDAVISPSGTGITYTATASRALYGLERGGHLPALVGRVHPLFGVPRNAMWINLALGFACLYLFPNWGALAAVISITCVIGFLMGPISVVTLRRTAPQLHRPLRLRGLRVLAPLAFVFASLLLYWSRWPLTGQIILLVLLGLPIYLYYETRRGRAQAWSALWSGLWLVGYLACMTALSWLGARDFGGTGLVPYGLDMVLVVVVALTFYGLGLRAGSRYVHGDLPSGLEESDVPAESQSPATRPSATR